MTDPKERPEATTDTEPTAESGSDQQNHPLSDDDTQEVVGGTTSEYHSYTQSQSQADKQASKWAQLPQSSPGFGE